MNSDFKWKTPLEYIRWALLSVLSGVLAGLSATVFLYLLAYATDFREQNRSLILFLPVAGFFIGWVYHRFGGSVAKGNNLILDEIHEPKKVIPLRMAPFILLGTVMTHLFGGSAGREGTAVQMGASLSDQLSKFFRIESSERRILLAAGAGAGFGAAIGAPWAGAVFGMEVIHVGKLRTFAAIECLIASHIGFFVSKFLHAPHTLYPSIIIPEWSISSAGVSLVVGILFGVVTVLFIRSTHFIEKLQKKWVKYPPLRPLVGGVVLVALYFLEGSFRFTGLGIPVIQEALSTPAHFSDSFYKILFTVITIGSGFKGGEFIPLVFIGTTLGSALSVFLPGGFGFLGVLGFAAVFGSAANTPIACTFMVMELFGAKIGGFAAIACFAAYYSTFHHQIYSSQKIHKTKLQRLRDIVFFSSD